MKSFFIVIFFLGIQLYAQDNLFHHNRDLYADFELSKEEILELQSQGKLSIFNQEKHKTGLAKKLFNRGEGGVLRLKRSQKKKLKVIKSVEVEHYRINYIFFDEKKASYEILDQLRNQILDLSQSQKFEHLAERYSMDMNRYKGGDSGWFKSRSVPLDFKNAVLSGMRIENETFKVDLEQKGWYYLVFKSYPPKLIREILVLETLE